MVRNIQSKITTEKYDKLYPSGSFLRNGFWFYVFIDTFKRDSV